MRRFPYPDRKEFQVFKKCTSPARVQDFLNTLPINFEPDGVDTCRSPLEMLRNGTAHCFEGAVLAAAIFWFQGRKPMLLDLETSSYDDSHVLALFQEGSCWGAVSKTNHAVLRFRDPIYKNIRELVMSYFHEYFLHSGEKTLRTYSKKPLNLLDFEDEWLVAEYPIWGLHDDLVSAPHEKIASVGALRKLRRADEIEIKAGKLIEWKE